MVLVTTRWLRVVTAIYEVTLPFSYWGSIPTKVDLMAYGFSCSIFMNVRNSIQMK